MLGVVLQVGDGWCHDQFVVRSLRKRMDSDSIVDEGHCASAGLRASASRSRR